MMTQTRLPFQYQRENSGRGLTSFAGLPLYMELARVTGLCVKIAETLKTKGQGWTELQMVLSLVLLNLAGGDCVDDIERPESDEGMRTLLLKIETQGMTRKGARPDGHVRPRRVKYCATRENKRFGVIEFAISARVSASFKQAVATVPEKAWRPICKQDAEGNPLKTEQEWL